MLEQNAGKKALRGKEKLQGAFKPDIFVTPGLGLRQRAGD